MMKLGLLVHKFYQLAKLGFVYQGGARYRNSCAKLSPDHVEWHLVFLLPKLSDF
jgi:hypothetical protein